jgi:hypothetical protein
VTHIELGVVNVLDRDMLQFHDFIFLGLKRADPRAGIPPEWPREVRSTN